MLFKLLNLWWFVKVATENEYTWKYKILLNEKIKQNSKHTHCLQLGLHFDGRIKRVWGWCFSDSTGRARGDQQTQVQGPRLRPGSTADLPCEVLKILLNQSFLWASTFLIHITNIYRTPATDQGLGWALWSQKMALCPWSQGDSQSLWKRKGVIRCYLSSPSAWTANEPMSLNIISCSLPVMNVCEVAWVHAMF